MKHHKSHIYIKFIAMVLSVAMLMASAIVPVTAEKTDKSVTFATLSDLIYVSSENRGGYNQAFLLDAAANGYQYEQLDGLVDSAFDAVKKSVEEDGLRYLLVNGDLTYNGEYTNHVALAEKLVELENETGVNVIVCNGANDANSTNPSSFASGKRETVLPATSSQFKTIYSELGLDIAANVYTAYDRNSAGLSYSVELEGGYRLLVIDASYYEYINGHTTVTGRISSQLLEWIKTECTIARHAGQTLIGMCSWSLAGEDITGTSDILIGADSFANVLADAGMHFIFTAGTGRNDISAIISDKGNVIYDVQSAGLVSFPNTFRVSSFKGEKGHFEVVDADEVTPVVSRKGTEYAKPYRETASLKIQYSNFDLAKYFSDIVRNYVTSILIPGVKQNKTLESFVLSQYGISLTDYINELIGGGLNIMDIVVIFDAGNIMNMLEDVYQQAQTSLLQDENELSDLCYKRFKAIFEAQISDMKCDKFLDTYGFGSKEQGGTVGDLIFSMLVYSQCGNEDSSDDAFVNDVIKNFESGELVPFMADMLARILIRDLLFTDILSQVEMKPQYLVFLDDTPESLGYYLQIAFKAYLALSGEDSSITGALNAILKTGVLDQYGESLDELIDYFINYYYSEGKEIIPGQQIAEILRTYVTDDDPEKQGDYDVEYDGTTSALSYADKKNYRLPTMITVTPGNKTTSEAYITWYTKATVTGSDIEIYADKDATFYGAHFIGVEGVKIVTATNEIERTATTLDLGFTTVGEKIVQLRQHTMKITGLEAGRTYFLRVGDSTKGWWSETITVTTAQDSETLSLIHVSDTMGNTPEDFDVFRNILDCADYLYPDTDFVLHTGNYVDDNRDLDQWQMMLDGNASRLLSSYLVPVAGSHDNIDTIKQNFAIGSLLGESEKTGVYYSFDYNIAHIVVLDSSCIKEDGTLTDEQLEWFKNDMNKTQAKWKIVAIHNPVYTNGDFCQEEIYTDYMNQMTGLMETYNIDIVLSGSDGVYYRTDGMAKNEVTDPPKVSYPYQGDGETYYKTIPNPVGVVYSSLGSSGSMSADRHSVNSVDFPESGYNTNPKNPMFSAIEIYGDTLYLTSYTLSGNRAKKIDSVSIKKGSDATGDVNYDGKVTAADARLVLRATAQLELLTADQLRLADLSGDGRLSAADARLVLRKAASLD